MNFYCDIKVLSDPEASEPVLINNLVAKLHRVLVQQKSDNIGISFPSVNKNLGNIMRLHGEEESLSKLLQTNWLHGLRDYCSVSECLSVPEQCQYRIVKRLQKKSANNKRKRSIAKGWLTEQEAAERIRDELQVWLKLPFVQLKSSSTGQQIKLFIEHGELLAELVEGDFNTYGLSKTATVPWF